MMMKAVNDNTKSNTNAQSYNDDVAEAHYRALNNVSAWEGQSGRVTMGDLLAKASNDNRRNKLPRLA